MVQVNKLIRERIFDLHSKPRHYCQDVERINILRYTSTWTPLSVCVAAVKAHKLLAIDQCGKKESTQPILSGQICSGPLIHFRRKRVTVASLMILKSENIIHHSNDG